MPFPPNNPIDSFLEALTETHEIEEDNKSGLADIVDPTSELDFLAGSSDEFIDRQLNPPAEGVWDALVKWANDHPTITLALVGLAVSVYVLAPAWELLAALLETGSTVGESVNTASEEV